MLKDYDLSVGLEKAAYKKALGPLELRLGELQRQAHESGIPLLVVFEGLEASGKGTLINRLLLPLDPRGVKVHTILEPTEEERLRPFLWRFWIRTPARGRIVILDRSVYRRVLDDRVSGAARRRDRRAAFEEIDAFERQLTDDGTVLVKFWLHIGRKEQARRFRELERHPSMAWRVSKADWEQNRLYRKWIRAAEDMFEATSTPFAPWTIVEAVDERFATIKVLETVADALAKRIDRVRPEATAAAGSGRTRSSPRTKPTATERVTATSILSGVDLSIRLSRDAYGKALDRCQDRLRRLEHELYRRRRPLAILYEGWDAAGKGGNIKRLTRNLDPRGYEVVPVAAPDPAEKAHHYLWRFWNRLPKAGHITIFDRTWYGRVLVERIEGFCTETEWRRAYREINEFERHLTHFGMILVKFWLHLSPEEQLRRFREREKTAHKRWKITDEDWRNREKWEPYREAVDEMLLRTSTTYAPWTVVESDCKLHARIKAQKTVIEAVEKALD